MSYYCIISGLWPMLLFRYLWKFQNNFNKNQNGKNAIHIFRYSSVFNNKCPSFSLIGLVWKIFWYKCLHETRATEMVITRHIPLLLSRKLPWSTINSAPMSTHIIFLLTPSTSSAKMCSFLLSRYLLFFFNWQMRPRFHFFNLIKIPYLFNQRP